MLFTTVLVISALVVLIPGMSLFGIMMAAQVINGILLPILLVFMVIIAADKHSIQLHDNSRPLQITIDRAKEATYREAANLINELFNHFIRSKAAVTSLAFAAAAYGAAVIGSP